MRVLVFQHVDCEHPGSLRQFLAADNIPWDAVYLHRGDKIPSFELYDALWVMGGPMDVWDVEEHPWLVAEKAAIRQWVKDRVKQTLSRPMPRASVTCRRPRRDMWASKNVPEIGVLRR